MTQAERSPIPHSGGIPSTPSMRLLIVRDFATAVFGDEQVADHWLDRNDPSVLEGQCMVATACQTAEGFEQTMQELARIRRDRQDGPRQTGELIPPAAPTLPPPGIRRS